MTDPAQPREAGTNTRILRAAVLIGAATVVVRLLGLFKNQAIALRFGVGIDLEAFLVASMLPTYAFGVLTNTFPSALIPTYARIRRGEVGSDPGLVSNLASWAAIVLGVSVLLIVLLWQPFLQVVGGDFSAEKRELCTRLFYLLLPSLVLHGVASVWAAVLNAEKRFLVAVLAPGIIPIATSLLVLSYAGEWGAYALAVGHLLGVALEFCVLGWTARTTGQRILPSRPRRTPELNQVLSQYVPVLAGGLLMRSTTVVDQGMAAALLPAGNLAVLTYANVIVGAILAVAAMALGTAILPYLADMAGAGDHAAIRHCLRSNARLVLLLSIPAAGVILMARKPLVAIFFERGAFLEEDTRAVGAVLAMYVLQIPFYAIGILCARVISSLRANAILFRVSILNLVVNLGLNLLLLPVLGAAGIALSTALVYLISTAVMWWWIERHLAPRVA